MAAVAPADRAILDRELAEALHREIDRLPGAFRVPVVLCYFEGLTLDEAAHRLHWPVGTLRSRLARARDKLRRGLVRRGVVLPATAMAAALAPRSASASVSSLLCGSTTRAAIAFATHHAAGEALSAPAAAMAQEVLRTMLLRKLKAAALSLVLLATLAAGAGYLVQRPAAAEDEPHPSTASTPRIVARPDDSPRPAPGRMWITGRVLDPRGRPSAGASVMAYALARTSGHGDRVEQMCPSPMGQARSDDSGTFRLDAPRMTSATHSRAGVIAIAPGLGAGWIDLDLDADQPVADIALRPERVIHGRLFDVQGRAARGVAVTVEAMGRVVRREGEDEVDGPAFWWPRARDLPAWPGPAVTDADGRFTVRGAGPGIRVALVVDDPRFAIHPVDVDTGEAAAPPPGPVAVTLEPARTIAGRVTDAETGKPVPHARFQVSGVRGEKALTDVSLTGADGRFLARAMSADAYGVTVYPPDGQLYLNTSKTLDWPKGAIRQSVELSLARGTVIRGKVVEEGSGKPVAAAMVDYLSNLDATPRDWHGLAETNPDGSFQLAVVPRPGYLIVRAPDEDHVLVETGQRTIFGGKGGRRFYAHAFIACEPRPDGKGPEVTVALKRGASLKGRVIGPDDRPVPEAQLISRLFLYPTFRAWSLWLGSEHGRVRDGRFELHGLPTPGAVPVHIFDPVRKLGATVNASGRPAGDGPLVVRLEPCGTARMRLVDPAGNPVKGYRDPYLIWMVATPGPDYPSDRPGEDRLLADRAFLSRVDPLNYGEDPVSDPQGRVTFPALIPGATYRIYDQTSRKATGDWPRRKEFTVKPGQTLDLGDVLIEKPPG
jgi:Sigma-70, region 4